MANENEAPSAPAARAVAPAAAKDDEMTFRQYVVENNIPLALARHVAAEQKLNDESVGTAEKFAELLDATTKARV